MQKFSTEQFHNDPSDPRLKSARRKLKDLPSLDAGVANDFAPLFRFVGDELAEIGRRTDQHHAAHVGEPRFDRGIGEAGIGLPVERFDNVGWSTGRRGDTEP
jgi:hypothetical protein